MGYFEMLIWSATGSRRKKRPGFIGQQVAKHRAEKRYLKQAVRRMELNAEARKLYAKRHPAPELPHVIPGAAPESRYSNPGFWANREPKVKQYKDPRDFWLTRGL
jgi:hypothetical protein